MHSVEEGLFFPLNARNKQQVFLPIQSRSSWPFNIRAARYDLWLQTCSDLSLPRMSDNCFRRSLFEESSLRYCRACRNSGAYVAIFATTGERRSNAALKKYSRGFLKWRGRLIVIRVNDGGYIMPFTTCKRGMLLRALQR